MVIAHYQIGRQWVTYPLRRSLFEFLGVTDYFQIEFQKAMFRFRRPLFGCLVGTARYQIGCQQVMFPFRRRQKQVSAQLLLFDS